MSYYGVSDKTKIADIADEIDVMKSLAKPRKVTIHGSDGQTYAFLGKPKDDLRKDARLMDFNSIINKILNMNSDSRRRQLRTPYVLFGMTFYNRTSYRYSYLRRCHSQ